MSEYANDAKTLHTALKSKPKDKQAINKLVSRRANDERLRIKKEYEALYTIELQTDLETELKKEDKEYSEVIRSLFLHPIDFDCQELFTAIDGAGTNDETLCEILTTRPNCILKLLKQQYGKLYNETLEKAVKSDTSSDYKKLLLHLLDEKRTANMNPDLKECETIAQTLYAGGKGKLGTNEQVYIQIFGTKSPIELVAINLIYNKIEGNSSSLYQAIKNAYNGDMVLLLTTLLDSSSSQSKYFANRLINLVKKQEFKKIFRILITRKEIDLPLILQHYYSLEHHHIIDDIANFKNEDIRELLLEFIQYH